MVPFADGLNYVCGDHLFRFFSTLGGGKHTLFVDFLIVGLFLIWFSSYFISDKDIALISFRKFRHGKIINIEALRHALKCYNKSVDFRFSSQKMSAIAEYVKYAYDLDLEECKKNIDMRVSQIIHSLEDKQYGQIPDFLAQLSVDCDSFLKTYSGLGIEIKASRWIRLKEHVSSSLLKILPQLFWLLIIIVIYLILRTFIPIEISFP